MKILITGNMGYIGPIVVSHLKRTIPNAQLVGYDMGYFATRLTSNILPEVQLDRQVFGDVRKIKKELLCGIEAVVYLAAISNDPMGEAFSKATLDINYHSTIEWAKAAKHAGVKRFIFASSCSVYGFSEEGICDENSPLHPLTAYAKSKLLSEQELKPLAGTDFAVTCFRFATACGMSPRLRLDLVLNDFAAAALLSQKIAILSDGSPWRPLINVHDMARAIEWGIRRKPEIGGAYLVVNAGSHSWNYQIKELARAVSSVIPSEVCIAQNSQPDKRSYRVNFDLFKRLAPDFQPKYDLTTTVEELIVGMKQTAIPKDFRNSSLIRLNALSKLKEYRLVNENLEWN